MPVADTIQRAAILSAPCPNLTQMWHRNLVCPTCTMLDEIARLNGLVTTTLDERDRLLNGIDSVYMSGFVEGTPEEIEAALQLSMEALYATTNAIRPLPDVTPEARGAAAEEPTDEEPLPGQPEPEEGV